MCVVGFEAAVLNLKGSGSPLLEDDVARQPQDEPFATKGSSRDANARARPRLAGVDRRQAADAHRSRPPQRLAPLDRQLARSDVLAFGVLRRWRPFLKVPRLQLDAPRR